MYLLIFLSCLATVSPETSAQIDKAGIVCKHLSPTRQVPAETLNSLYGGDGGPFTMKRSQCTDYDFTAIKVHVLRSAYLFLVGYEVISKKNGTLYALTVKPERSISFTAYTGSPLLSLFIRHRETNDLKAEFKYKNQTVRYTILEKTFVVFRSQPWDNWREHGEAQIEAEIVPKAENVHFHAFAILCEPKGQQQTTQCAPDYEKGVIYCNCKYEPVSLVPNFLLLVVAIACVGLTVLFFSFKMKQDYEIGMPDVIYITCSSRTAKYQYDLCFKVGCPTIDFDMENTTIDLALLDPENRVTCHCRILSKYLLQESITKVHFAMFRLTPLSPASLQTVTFSFSGGPYTSALYFYGVVITDVMSDDSFKFPVKKYIRPTVRSEPLIASSDDGLPDYEKDGEVPKVITPPLHLMEYAIILSVTFDIVGFVCLYLSAVRSPYLSVAPAALVGFPITLIMGAFYRYFIKYKLAQHKLLYDAESAVFKFAQYIYFASAILLNLTIAISTYIFFANKRVVVSRLPGWFGSTFLSFSLVLLLISILSICKDQISTALGIAKRRTSISKTDGGIVESRESGSSRMSKTGSSLMEPAVKKSKALPSTTDGLDSILSRFEKAKEGKGMALKTQNKGVLTVQSGKHPTFYRPGKIKFGSLFSQSAISSAMARSNSQI